VPFAPDASRKRRLFFGTGAVFRSGWVVAVGLVFAGCSTSYEVRVRSFTRPEVQPPTTYRLIETPVGADDPTIFRQTAEVLRRALATKGLREVGAGTDPELLVLYGCEVGSPATRHTTESSPVFVMVPGRTYTETVQVGTSSSGAPIYQTVTRQEPPTQQIAGYQERQVATNIYRKFLRIKAVASHLPPGQRERMAYWAVEASCDGESKDYAQVLPMLAAASMVYLGRASDGTELIRLSDGDKDVRHIKSGR
jgi:hypothetical protein